MKRSIVVTIAIAALCVLALILAMSAMNSKAVGTEGFVCVPDSRYPGWGWDQSMNGGTGGSCQTGGGGGCVPDARYPGWGWDQSMNGGKGGSCQTTAGAQQSQTQPQQQAVFAAAAQSQPQQQGGGGGQTCVPDSRYPGWGWDQSMNGGKGGSCQTTGGGTGTSTSTTTPTPTGPTPTGPTPTGPTPTGPTPTPTQPQTNLSTTNTVRCMERLGQTMTATPPQNMDNSKTPGFPECEGVARFSTMYDPGTQKWVVFVGPNGAQVQQGGGQLDTNTAKNTVIANVCALANDKTSWVCGGSGAVQSTPAPTPAPAQIKCDSVACLDKAARLMASMIVGQNIDNSGYPGIPECQGCPRFKIEKHAVGFDIYAGDTTNMTKIVHQEQNVDNARNGLILNFCKLANDKTSWVCGGSGAVQSSPVPAPAPAPAQGGVCSEACYGVVNIEMDGGKSFDNRDGKWNECRGCPPMFVQKWGDKWDVYVGPNVVRQVDMNTAKAFVRSGPTPCQPSSCANQILSREGGMGTDPKGKIREKYIWYKPNGPGAIPECASCQSLDDVVNAAPTPNLQSHLKCDSVACLDKAGKMMASMTVGQNMDNSGYPGIYGECSGCPRFKIERHAVGFDIYVGSTKIVHQEPNVDNARNGLILNFCKQANDTSSWVCGGSGGVPSGTPATGSIAATAATNESCSRDACVMSVKKMAQNPNVAYNALLSEIGWNADNFPGCVGCKVTQDWQNMFQEAKKESGPKCKSAGCIEQMDNALNKMDPKNMNTYKSTQGQACNDCPVMDLQCFDNGGYKFDLYIDGTLREQTKTKDAVRNTIIAHLCDNKRSMDHPSRLCNRN